PELLLSRWRIQDTTGLFLRVPACDHICWQALLQTKRREQCHRGLWPPPYRESNHSDSRSLEYLSPHQRQRLYRIQKESLPTLPLMREGGRISWLSCYGFIIQLKNPS